MTKLLPLVLVLIATLTTFAEDLDSQVRYVIGRGTESRFCQDTWICPDSVRRSARQNADDDGSFQCRLQQGTPDLFGASCFESCQPPFIPQDKPTWVSCRSECQVRCVFPDPTTTEENQ